MRLPLIEQGAARSLAERHLAPVGIFVTSLHNSGLIHCGGGARSEITSLVGGWRVRFTLLMSPICRHAPEIADSISPSRIRSFHQPSPGAKIRNPIET